MSRRELLRDELVQRVASQRRRPPVRLIVASVLAFSLAGLGTGGIVASAALAQNRETVDSSSLDLSDVQAAGMQRVEERGLDALATFTVRGAATTLLDMGERPKDADSIVYAVQCLDHTDVVVTVAGQVDESLSCVDEATWRIGSSRIVAMDANSLKVDVQGGRYAVWAAWTSGFSDPQFPNDQSGYLAYGVTRAEYLAAFGEFSNCVTGFGTGNELVDVDTSGTFIEYDPGDSDEIAVSFCYAHWFGSVAQAWAEQNE